MSNNKILKSLSDGLEEVKQLLKSKLEKGGKFPVGTVRNWGGKDYKKIGEGNWEEVKKPGSGKSGPDNKFSSGKLEITFGNHKETLDYAKQFGVEAKRVNREGINGLPEYEFTGSKENVSKLLNDYFDGDEELVGESLKQIGSSIELDIAEERPGDAIKYAKEFGVEAKRFSQEDRITGHPVYKFSGPKENLKELLNDYYSNDEDILKEAIMTIDY